MVKFYEKFNIFSLIFLPMSAWQAGLSDLSYGIAIGSQPHSPAAALSWGIQKGSQPHSPAAELS